VAEVELRFLYQKLPEEKQTGLDLPGKPASANFGAATSDQITAFINQGVNGEEDEKQTSN